MSDTLHKRFNYVYYKKHTSTHSLSVKFAFINFMLRLCLILCIYIMFTIWSIHLPTPCNFVSFCMISMILFSACAVCLLVIWNLLYIQSKYITWKLGKVVSHVKFCKVQACLPCVVDYHSFYCNILNECSCEPVYWISTCLLLVLKRYLHFVFSIIILTKF